VGISTMKGDGGETGLLGGGRILKSAPRVGALGEIDELNAFVGVARAMAEDPELAGVLGSIQRDLLALGALMAASERALVGDERSSWDRERVARLDQWLDECESRLPALRSFLVPGGVPLAGALHVARTVCRRAERSVVALSQVEAVDPRALVYLNRLSDLLYVLAREANHRAGVGDDTW
jgi:cob(I)alamin adenosyltransferase